MPPLTAYRYGASPARLIPVNGGEDVSITPAPPPTTDWYSAFESRDMQGTQPGREPAEPIGPIRAWYEANTGHDISLSYELLGAGTWTIDLAWLQAREGNGRVSFSGGRWYVERYETPGQIRFATNNVTLTNCYHNSTGALYGVHSPTANNASGIVMDHCTIAGNGMNRNGAAVYFPAARSVDQIIIRHCDISGYRAGIYCIGGITAHYNWSHDLEFSIDPVTGEGSHNTASSMRAENNHLFRNLLADGNSSCISYYPENRPYTNCIAEENILRLPADDLVGTEVLLATGRLASEVLPGETRILRNNLFYKGNEGEGGGIGGYIAGFTEISGNINRHGEAVTP